MTRLIFLRSSLRGRKRKCETNSSELAELTQHRNFHRTLSNSLCSVAFSSSQRAHSNEPLVTVIHFENSRMDYPSLAVGLPTWSGPHHTYLCLPSSTRSKNIAGNSSNTSQVPQTPRCGRKVNPQLCFQLLVECLQQNEGADQVAKQLAEVS